MLKRIRLAGGLAVLVSLAPIQGTFAQTKARDTQKKQTALKLEDEFLPHVVEMNAAEAQFGRIGASRAQNARVREYAQMIAQVHSDTVENLGGLYHTGAHKRTTQMTQREKPRDQAHRHMDTYTKIKLSAADQRIADSLNRLSGAALDREFMNVMITRHQKGVDFYQTHLDAFTTGTAAAEAKAKQTPQHTSAQISDPNVREAFALLCRTLLPVVRDHLGQAQNIRRDLGGMTTKQN